MEIRPSMFEAIDPCNKLPTSVPSMHLYSGACSINLMVLGASHLEVAGAGPYVRETALPCCTRGLGLRTQGLWFGHDLDFLLISEEAARIAAAER